MNFLPQGSKIFRIKLFKRHGFYYGSAHRFVRIAVAMLQRLPDVGIIVLREDA